jgi:hypothetical protein
MYFLNSPPPGHPDNRSVPGRMKKPWRLFFFSETKTRRLRTTWLPGMRLIDNVKMLLAGKRRYASYSLFEILAVVVILAFFIFMLIL